MAITQEARLAVAERSKKARKRLYQMMDQNQRAHNQAVSKFEQEGLADQKAQREAERDDRLDWGSSAAKGAAMGSAAGPYGALAGGIAGSLKGQMDAFQARKEKGEGGIGAFFNTFVNPITTFKNFAGGAAKAAGATSTAVGSVGREVERSRGMGLDSGDAMSQDIERENQLKSAGVGDSSKPKLLSFQDRINKVDNSRFGWGFSNPQSK